MVSRSRNWGEDRVLYYDGDGKLKYLIANITDVVPEDAFARVSSGRSAFRVDDLLEPRELLDRKNQRGGGGHDV